MTAALCLAMTVSAQNTETVTGVVVADSTESVVLIEEQIANDEAAPSQTDTVQESPLAKKMTQAEKAQNAAVNDSWGGAITLIAMCIVISALAILSILFLCFGKISESIIAKRKEASAKKVNVDGTPHEHTERIDSGDAIAAIAMALSEHFGDGHDIEDTILTIRRLQRNYSPWNSKLYNLRQSPELHQNKPRRNAF